MVARKQFFEQAPFDDELDRLVSEARKTSVTDDDLKEQRISFAFGNILDCDDVTKESVRKSSETLLLS